MKRINFFFGLPFLPSVWDYRSMKLLRLFSGKLPAMIEYLPWTAVNAFSNYIWKHPREDHFLQNWLKSYFVYNEKSVWL